MDRLLLVGWEGSTMAMYIGRQYLGLVVTHSRIDCPCVYWFAIFMLVRIWL